MTKRLKVIKFLEELAGAYLRAFVRTFVRQNRINY